MAVIGRYKTRAEIEREKEEEEKKKAGGFMLPTYEELALIEEKAKEDAEAAASSEKKLEFFQKPSNFDDGYQFGDVTKSVLGTVGDIGVGAAKGVMKMGEGIGDAAQYGAAALANLFGADEKAEAIRQNAQKEKVAAAFSGVDDYLDKYSVLGRTGDAAAESLGQIGAVIGAAGIAGLAGLGAVGTTAATTGLMGLSSFGSGTSEAYAAGAKEGEAEAYGAIAGAADALSEMIFGGLGKGFKALGISKGLTSADDMLARALTKNIRNTLAKNAVQLGIKGAAEGLEEVLAGTMQAAGKKMTYMSEQDFADIIKDENLLEQFVVGAFASGVAQAPSMVRATRAGVDLVSDDGADAAETRTEGTGEAKRIWDDNNTEHAEIERTGRDSGAADDDIRMAGELSDVLGKRIRFYREEAKDGTIRNGEYHEDEDTIYINAASKNVKSQIVAHELTHSIERAGAYKSLVDLTMEKLEAEQKAKGETLEDLYRKKEMLYAKADARLGSYEEITSELVAEFVEKRLLTDAESIKSLVQENRTLGQKIKDWFDSVLAKMGNADAQSREYLRKMRDVYAEALGENIENNGNRVRHSINPEFVSRLDAWDQQTEGFAFVIGNTSEALKKAGVPDKQIRMDASKMKKLLNKHSGMTIDILKQIPELLENPVIVIDSKSKNNSKIVMGELYDDNDKLVTTVLLLAPSSRSGNVLDMIKISSAEGRGHIGSLLKKDDGTPVDVRYVDEKRIHDWLNVNKLQLPLRNLGQDSNGSISQGGVNVKGNGTISELGMEEISPESRIERSHGRKYSVSEAEDGIYLDAVNNGDVETAQKMVDDVAKEHGYSIKAYHGTPNKGITFFDEKKIGETTDEGLFGRGFYFSTNKATADGYAGENGETMSVFLKIKNPWWGNAHKMQEVLEQLDIEESALTTRTIEKRSHVVAPLQRFSGVFTSKLKEKGFDSVIVQHGKHDYEIVVFDNKNIKSADPVTYDDDGNVIPLSERFEANNPDIRYSVSKSDESDKRVMPKRSATGSKARARQEQQERARFEKKVMNRGFENLTEAEQAHYRDEMVLHYKEKYTEYKKKRDALIASGYQFAGADDYAEKVVGGVEDAAIDANTFLIHYQEGVFGDPAREDVQEFAFDYLQMLGAHRPDTSETYIETQDSEMPSDEDAPPMRGSAAEYGEPETIEVEAEPKLTRKVLHKNIMDGIKKKFEAAGFDLDKVFAKAKDLSTFATVDNTPPRVMEKSLGYKEGKVLADATVNQAAKNETEGIRWLNRFTDRKDGVLAQLSKKYNIKPGSKESAAAQMYAEGFYVNDKNEIIEYGDRELAADFPDAQVQKNIKGLAHDPTIRQIYDETLDAINASRTRNAFPEIQKLDNYYLHFRAMDDTFSRLGIPFNPNDIRAKDLPTNLNGVTADLKPGQPYFASANHRLGKRTSFDLLGGLEQYLTSAKNQIYHIDDIQTLRALRNYVADMYGQAEGLSNLDELSDEEVEARIKDVYSSHLSTFAKFLNEEANILAGKTSLIDRGLEGVIGRRGITFLNDINKQVGANMVGFNISSSLTNFLAPVQAFAKMNKAAFVKGFAQTVENRLKSITGNGDDFAQRSDVIVRRKGADRFKRTAWQKMSDPGYLLMSMVDDISTEIIARAKYNELTKKGMDAETANRETDKWVSRLMGDRSIGQMPQIYNSKMLGLITKFQLEVRNQLDSQFYDTIKEAQVEYENIGEKTKRNAKTAAKVAATFAELAVAQHLFGQVFEKIAGYNPAFDIIEVIATVLGLDDEEDSEDTVLDNIEQGVLALIEDLPYSSVITDGGRIPISSALPISELVTGEDQYGGEKNRLKTLGEALPYYVLPGGYGQIKKTAKGVSMFTGDKPVTGSYTDSGNLRFPVEATAGNVAQAAVFGQWASENARDYFDNERKPISERQAHGYAESGLEWKDYQKYKSKITSFEKDSEKVSAIKALDIGEDAKIALYRSLVASAVKDEDGNIIGTSEDERIAALEAAGLDFEDFLTAKEKQASLNADKDLTANQRATRFYAWAANAGYTDEQADVITDQFKFSSGFKVEPAQYNKLVDAGVTADNAVTVTDALSGTSRAIDKINAIWSTGLTGEQLDTAIKAVVTEGWYERYRTVIDANVPLDVLTWVLDNADANGNDSIDNEERTLILSQLALSRKELSALWIATGGSEKSNPWGSGSTTSSKTSKVSVKTPTVKTPSVKTPSVSTPQININVPYFGFDLEE